MMKILVAAVVCWVAAAPAAGQQSVDVDASGALDHHDLVEFERLYSAGDAGADVNRDGRIDYFDLLEFHNAFAFGRPGGETDFTFDGTLYNGLGPNDDHFTEEANLEWGNTSSAFTWFTQTRLHIRDRRHYKVPGGSGCGCSSHFFQIDFGWVPFSGATDCDVAPSGDPAGWDYKYGGATSQTALGDWIDHGKAIAQNAITKYEIAYGTGSSEGLKILLDNETIMDRGGKVGLGLRTSPWCQKKFYEYVYTSGGTTTTFIDRYSELATDAMTDFIVGLKTEHPDIDFAWYGIPHHSRFNAPTKELLEGLGKSPCSTGTSIDCTYYPALWNDGRDLASIPLLGEGQFVDGHSYRLDRSYHQGNLTRMRNVAEAAERPLVATTWIGCPTSSEYDDLRDFFEVCVDLEIEQAAILGSWGVFKQLAAQQGKDPGKYWRERVVTAAVDAEFLDSAGPNPPSKLTLASVTPSFGEQGETVDVVLHGSGFDNGTNVGAGSDISVASVTVVGDTIEALFTIDAGATTGEHAVTVWNSTETFTLDEAFVVIEPSDPAPTPVIDGLCEPRLQRGFTHTVAVAGLHFQDGIDASFSGGGVTLDGVTFVSSRLVLVTMSVSGSATVGDRTLSLSNPDSQTATGIFYVVE